MTLWKPTPVLDEVRTSGGKPWIQYPGEKVTEIYMKVTESDQKVTELPNSLWIFYDHSGPKFRTSERNLSYPKTFLRLFNYRRFEGVEPPEGCKNVS